MTDSGDTQPLTTVRRQSPPLASPTPSSSRPRRTVFRWLLSALVAIFIMLVVGMCGIVALVYVQARTDEAQPVDAIIVMGAAQYNGRPSLVLEARLEHALALYEAGYAPNIVVTGGKQSGDEFTEAQAESDYLVERGVPQSAILMEDEGRSTWQSMQGVPEVLSPVNGTSVLVVSDGFHLFRSELMLRSLGYRTFGSAAPSSPIRPWSASEFAYVIRETGGVLVFLPEYLW